MQQNTFNSFDSSSPKHNDSENEKQLEKEKASKAKAERQAALWRYLEKGFKHQALVKLSKEVPEGRGRAIAKQPDAARVPQVVFMVQLVAARKSQKLSQRQLAAMIGTSQTTIARIERGQTSPSLGIIFKIISALGLRWTLE